MSVRKVLQAGTPSLREKSEPITKINKQVIKILDDMIDTMDSYDAVGLAAPQIGVNKRIIVVNPGTGLIELINPVITKCEGEYLDREGCLSVEKYQGDVVRYQSIFVEGLTRTGKRIRFTAKDLLARAIQHEIDHLEGILFVDRALALFEIQQNGEEV